MKKTKNAFPTTLIQLYRNKKTRIRTHTHTHSHIHKTINLFLLSLKHTTTHTHLLLGKEEDKMSVEPTKRG